MSRIHFPFACILYLASASICLGQLVDPLPDIPPSFITVKAIEFNADLPITEESNNPSFVQRVGPTDLVEIPNGSGNILIATFGGTVLLSDTHGNTSSALFLELDSPTSPNHNPMFSTGTAHGMTSIAFHPGFSDATHPAYGRFYTLESEDVGSGTPDFTRSTAGGSHHDGVLYEYTLSSHLDTQCDATCAAAKRELIRVKQPGYHHNFGDLAFDSAELLYISSGDGSTSGTTPITMSDNAQSLSTVFGAILRIDPLGSNSENGQYGIPATNPFIDGPAGNVDEIYAYGLRNPYRMDFDEATGELYASDTGEFSIESVDIIQAGGNYGWNSKEGSFVFDKLTRGISIDTDGDGDGVGDVAQANGYIDPVLEYDRDDGRSIIGGVLYRGHAIAALDGSYVFADLNRQLYHGDSVTGERFEFLIDSEGEPLPFNIHSINEDLSGNIYVLGVRKDTSMSPEVYDGVVFKIVTERACDFDGNFNCGHDDINELLDALGSADPHFDLDTNGTVDESDIHAWLIDAGNGNIGTPYSVGDADLDGDVDVDDLNLLGVNWRSVTELKWQDGNFNGDGGIDPLDLNELAIRWQHGVVVVASVPEPGGTAALLFFAGLVFLSNRKALTPVPTVPCRLSSRTPENRWPFRH